MLPTSRGCECWRWSPRRGWRAYFCIQLTGRVPHCCLVMAQGAAWRRPIWWRPGQRRWRSVSVSPWWSSRTGWQDDGRLPRRASWTLLGLRWSPACGSGSWADCPYWSGGALWGRELRAELLALQKQSRSSVLRSRCSRPEGRQPLRVSVVSPSWSGVAVPVLVVQGTRDPFGIPPSSRRRTVVEVAGDHGLKADLPAVSAAVRSWLAELLAGLGSGPSAAGRQQTRSTG
jgi:hypothetical protein